MTYIHQVLITHSVPVQCCKPRDREALKSIIALVEATLNFQITVRAGLTYVDFTNSLTNRQKSPQAFAFSAILVKHTSEMNVLVSL